VRQLLLTRIQITVAAFVIIGAVLAVLVPWYRSPEIRCLTIDSRAPWIMYPTEVVINALAANTHRPSLAAFRREFDGPTRPGKVTVTFRAMRSARVWVNGRPAMSSFSSGARWKNPRTIDISQLVHPGRNWIVVQVKSVLGPPLLSLRIEGLGQPLATGESWDTILNAAPPRKAMIADDTRPHPDNLTARDSLSNAGDYAPILLLAFVFSCAAFALRARLPRAIARNPALAALVGIAVVWLVIFITRTASLPLNRGFDATHHIKYITFLYNQHRLPDASNGWSMYHPPLYYTLAALFAAPGAALGGKETAAVFIKLVAFFSGLGSLWVSYALGMKLFAGDRVKQFVTVLVAGTLPMGIYISAYCSNESTTAFLIGLATLCAVNVLHERDTSLRGMLVLGVVCGLAMLTKFTSLVAVPVLFGVVACKILFVEKAPIGRACKLLGVGIGAAFALSGWFYIRNAIIFGSPLHGNWDFDSSGAAWWQEPGFHTARYYLRFGRSLIHPFFSGMASYWDSLYSTFWGDGQVAGHGILTSRHDAWNWELMSVVYPLAIPATLAMVLGYAKAVKAAVCERDMARRLSMWMLTLLVTAVGASMLLVTMKLPYFGQAKAFYGLGLLAPISIAAALGLGAVDERLRSAPWARVVLYGWLGMLGVVIVLAFAGVEV